MVFITMTVLDSAVRQLNYLQNVTQLNEESGCAPAVRTRGNKINLQRPIECLICFNNEYENACISAESHKLMVDLR